MVVEGGLPAKKRVFIITTLFIELKQTQSSRRKLILLLKAHLHL
jgi:hypothetical protein